MLLDLGVWVPILDGDPEAVALFERHYSSRKSLARRRERGTRLFVGAGNKLVLSTPDRLALFAWRRAKFRRDGQTGVECAVFSNRGDALSSDLIREADRIADERWPGERHFTFVNVDETASRRGRASLPGKCFRAAGWRECGRSKVHDLLILERPA